MVHFRYSVDTRRPWAGLSPLQWASLTGRVHGNVERYLAEEAKTRHGHFVAGLSRGTTRRQRSEATNQLNERLDNPDTRSTLFMPEGYDASRGSGMPVRLGPQPLVENASLRSDTAIAIIAACGLSPALFQQNSDGTAQPEAWRRALHGSFAPLGRLMSKELATKLDAPGLIISFEKLFASDISGRARAWQSLVQSGKTPEETDRVAGLIVDDE